MSSIITRIRLMEPNLKGADARLALYIRERPSELIYRSVADVASESGVSEATVVRFARKLGLIGFQDLKLHLAREVIAPIRSIHESIAPEDPPAVVMRKVFGGHIAAMNDTLQVLDPLSIQKAVAALGKARHIYFVGVGTSGPNTLDAYNKFLRLGLSCSAHTDSHLQAMAVGLSSPEDVVLAITHSGNTRDTVYTLELARKRGATTIAVTNFSRSPVTRTADIVLYTASSETKFRAEAVASRVAQVAIVDTLWTLVALRDPKRTTELQNQVERAVIEKQF
ncbi:MAG: MurR/RpiR family transcriptional regulator [Calditrichaeota bacterium]|nr:MurR/RpiR family transcriptional regulator [Calditrichota bacterium]